MDKETRKELRDLWLYGIGLGILVILIEIILILKWWVLI